MITSDFENWEFGYRKYFKFSSFVEKVYPRFYKVVDTEKKKAFCVTVLSNSKNKQDFNFVIYLKFSSKIEVNFALKTIGNLGLAFTVKKTLRNDAKLMLLHFNPLIQKDP